MKYIILKHQSNLELLLVEMKHFTFRHLSAIETSHGTALKPFDLKGCHQGPAFAFELMVT